MDVRAANLKDISLDPGAFQPIPTGLCVALPEGFEIQVRSRSGLSAKHGVVVLNSPGTIDADYRGEIFVVLINHGDKPFVIERGTRIAQLVLAKTVQASWSEVIFFETETQRGAGGFGSTGLS